ncbi:MAG: single-stranded DNA-binding protein [Chlamydiota bacterium]
MNQTIIAGHLGADPEVRFTSSGQKVTTLRVGARARKDETIWWRVTIWGEQFDKMITYFKKGSSIIVFGELNKPEIFTDKEGRPQISMNITATNLLFSPFGKSDSQGTHSQSNSNSNSHSHMSALSAEAESVYSTSEASLGQGKMDLPFGDEEMPF